MENYLVGRMFYTALSLLSDKEIDELTTQEAFEVLDKIGNKVIETTSLDAEFGGYARPNQRLGRVLIKAYLPDKYNEWKHKGFVSDDMDSEWYYKLWKPFTMRFGFY